MVEFGFSFFLCSEWQELININFFTMIRTEIFTNSLPPSKPKTRFVFHLNQSIFGLILKTQQRIKLHAVIPDINRHTTNVQHNIWIPIFLHSFARNFLIDQKIMMKAEKRERNKRRQGEHIKLLLLLRAWLLFFLPLPIFHFHNKFPSRAFFFVWRLIRMCVKAISVCGKNTISIPFSR